MEVNNTFFHWKTHARTSRHLTLNLWQQSAKLQAGKIHFMQLQVSVLKWKLQYEEYQPLRREKNNNLTWTELIFESWFPDISSRMNQNVQKSLIVGNNFLSYCTWYFGPFSSEFYWILFHTIYIFLKKKNHICSQSWNFPDHDILAFITTYIFSFSYK